METRKQMFDRSAPVVVGGVGGSGTRVVASILMELRYYLGDLRIPSNDNRCFADLFFRRPTCLTSLSGISHVRLFKALELFEKLMFRRFTVPAGNPALWIKAICFTAFFWNDLKVSGRVRILRTGFSYWLKDIVSSEQLNYTEFVGWGWKEPASHIYIEYLNEYFGRMKYIHVIRNGLDMAYSNNQSQFYEYGGLFDAFVPDSPALAPEKGYLDYWIKANKRAVGLGKRLLGKRFMLLSFEELCRSTKREIERLISFLDLDRRSVDIDRLCNIVKKPKSIGRYRDQDLGIFSQEAIRAVKEIERTLNFESRQTQ